MANSGFTEKKDSPEHFKVVLFCGSSGAIAVLEDFLLHLKPKVRAAIVVVLHRKIDLQGHLAKYLDKKAKVTVKTIEHGTPLEQGTLFMVPAGYHCILEKDMSLSLDLSEKVMFSRPSADVSLESFSYHLKDRLIAVIVSGANSDGANGVKWVKKRKGKVIVQDPSEAFAKPMPSAAIEAVTAVDHIVPSREINTIVTKYL